MYLARAMVLAVSMLACVALGQDVHPKPHLGGKDGPNLQQLYQYLQCYSGGEKANCGYPEENKQIAISGDSFRLLLDKIGGKKKVEK